MHKKIISFENLSFGNYLNYLYHAFDARESRISAAVDVFAEKIATPYLFIFAGSSLNRKFMPGLFSDIDYFCITKDKDAEALAAFEAALSANYPVENIAARVGKDQGTDKKFVEQAELLEAFNPSPAQGILRSAVLSNAVFQRGSQRIEASLRRLRNYLRDDFFTKQPVNIIFPSAPETAEKPVRSNSKPPDYNLKFLFSKIKLLNLIRMCYPGQSALFTELENSRITNIYYSYSYLRDRYIIESPGINLDEPNSLTFTKNIYRQIGTAFLQTIRLPEQTENDDEFISGALKRAATQTEQGS